MKNKGTPAELAVAADDAVPAELSNPQGAAEGEGGGDDDLYEAAERELAGGESDETETDQAPVEEPEQAEPKTVEAAPAEAPSESTKVKIDLNAEYVFVDEGGNEHTVKGQDAAWLTNQMHRKVQEKHAQIEAYKPLEQRFQHDKGGLARDILTQATPAERLAAVKELLAQDGLTDMAESLDQRMAQANLQFDPLAPQRALLEQQQRDVQAQQSRFEAQQRLNADISQLQTSIGRQLTAREMAGIDSVYANYLQAKQFNPQLPVLPFSQAYKLAVDAMRFEESLKPQTPKPKQPTPAERAARGGAKSGPPTEDDLFVAAMREQGIAF